MNLNDVRKLNWIPVEDWSKIPRTTRSNKYYSNVIGKKDINDFVESHFHHVARCCGIEFSELKPLLEKENAPFFSLLNRVFESTHGFLATDTRFIDLQRLFRIPDVESISGSDDPVSVQNVLNSFKSLSKNDKLKVLQKLGTVSITFTFDAE